MNHLATIRHFLKGWGRFDIHSESGKADVAPLDRWLPGEEAGHVRAWSSFTNIHGIAAWSQRLKCLVHGHGVRDDWELLGYGVLIEHEDALRCAHIARRMAEDAGMRFLVVPEVNIAEFPFGELQAGSEPLLVFLEAGAWSAQLEDGPDGLRQVQEAVADCLRSFDPVHPVVFVSATPNIENFSSELRQVRVFDRYFVLPQAAPREVGANFLNLIGITHCSHALRAQTDKVGHFVMSEYESHDQLHLAALSLRRLSVEEARFVEFVDLLNVCLAGNAKLDSPEDYSAQQQEHTACHEAGHALMLYVMTGGRNMPEYTSILPGRDFSGLTVESYTYAPVVGKRMNFDDFVTKVRISLAGRAAEELIHSATRITRGCKGDLIDATRLARSAFTEWGYSPDMGQAGGDAYSNLMVLGDTASQAYISAIEKQIQGFLAREYQHTLDILRQRRPLLESIIARLRDEGYVDQENMAALCHASIDRLFRKRTNRKCPRRFQNAAQDSPNAVPAASGKNST